MAFFGSEGPLERELARLQKENREKDALLVSEETRYAAKCKEVHEVSLARNDALYRLQQEAERAAAAEQNLNKRQEELKQWQIKGHQMESALDQANKTIKELRRDNYKAQSDFETAASFTSAEKGVLEKRISQLEATLRAREVELAEANKASGTSERSRFGFNSTNMRRDSTTADESNKIAGLESQVAALRTENEQLVQAAKATNPPGTDRRASVLSSNIGRPRTSMGFNSSSSGIPLPSSRIPGPSSQSSGVGKRRRSSSFSGNNGSDGTALAVARFERDLAETRSTLVDTEKELSATKNKLAKAERELLKAENQLMALERSHKVELEGIRSKLEDASDEVLAAKADMEEGIRDAKQEAAAQQKAVQAALDSAKARVTGLEAEVNALGKERERLHSEKEAILRDSNATNADRDALHERIDNVQQQLVVISSDFDAAKLAQASAEAEAHEALERASSLEASLASANAVAVASSEEAASLKVQLEQAEKALISAADNAELASLQTNIVKLEQRLQQTEQQLASRSEQATKQVAEVEAELTARRSEVEALEAEVARLGSEKNQLRAAEKALEAEREAHATTKEELSQAVDTLVSELDAARRNLDSARLHLADTAQEIERVHVDLNAAKAELEDVDRALGERTKELFAATTECDGLRQRCSDLGDSQASSTNRMQALEEMLAGIANQPVRSFDDEEVHSLREKHAAAEAILRDVGTAFEDAKERLHGAEEKARSFEALEWGAVQGRDEALAKVAALETLVQKLEGERDEAIMALQSRLVAAEQALAQAQTEHEQALEAAAAACTAADLNTAGLEASAASKATEMVSTISTLEGRVADLQTTIGSIEGAKAQAQRTYESTAADFEAAAAKLLVCEAEIQKLRQEGREGDLAAKAAVEELQLRLEAETMAKQHAEAVAAQAAEAGKMMQVEPAEVEGRMGELEALRVSDKEVFEHRVAALSAQVEELGQQLADKTRELADAPGEQQSINAASCEQHQPMLHAKLEQASLLICRLRNEKAALADACTFAVTERNAAVDAYEQASSRLSSQLLTSEAQALAATRDLHTSIVVLLQGRRASRQHLARFRLEREAAFHELAALREQLQAAHSRQAETEIILAAQASSLVEAASASEAKSIELTAACDDFQRQLAEARSSLKQTMAECTGLKAEVKAFRQTSGGQISESTTATVALHQRAAHLEARVQRKHDLAVSRQLIIDQLEANLIIARGEVDAIAQQLDEAKSTAEQQHCELEAILHSRHCAVRQAEAERDEALSRITHLQKEVQDAASRTASMDLELGQHAKDSAAARSQVSNLEGELAVLHEQYGSQRTQLAAALSEAVLVSSQLDTLQKTSGNLTSANASLSQQVRELSAELLSTRNLASSLRTAFESHQQEGSAQMDQLRLQLEQTDAARTRLETALHQARSELSKSSDEMHLLGQELGQQCKEVDRLNADIAAKEGSILDLSEKVASSTSALNASKAEAAAVEVRLASMEMEIDGLKARAAGLENDLNIAEQERTDSLATIERFETALRAQSEEHTATRQQLSDEATEHTATIAELRIQLASAEAALCSSKEQHAEVGAAQSAEITSLSSSLEAVVAAASAAREELTSRLVELQADVVNLSHERDRLQESLDQAQHERSSYKQQLEEARAEVDAARSLADKAQIDLAQRDTEVLGTRAVEVASLQAELEEVQKGHATLGAEVVAKQEALTHAESVVDAQSQELEELKHELETLVEDFNGCTAELERMEGELKTKTDAEVELSERLAQSEALVAEIRQKLEQLEAERSNAETEIQRLTTVIGQEDASVTALKSDLAALAHTSQASEAAARSAEERVKELESQLEMKTLEVADAEDQLLLQMKENKRALNQIQKLKDKVHTLQRAAANSPPLSSAPEPPRQTPTASAAEPVEPPASASRKRKLDSVIGNRREVEPLSQPHAPTSAALSPKSASQPIARAPKWTVSSRKTVVVHADTERPSTSSRPRHIESQEELKPPGPDETYSARHAATPRNVLRERNTNAELPVQTAPPASSLRGKRTGKKESAPGGKGDATDPKKPAQAAKGTGGKSTADLLASIQALRRKQQQSAQAAQEAA